MNPAIQELPIFPALDRITDTFKQAGLLLLTAEPGAGKTTGVPWRFLQDPELSRFKILLLEPRRLAARAAATRLAALLGEPLGATVGLRTRLETVVGERTRLDVVTEGVLTRLIQNDPALEGYGAVIFDEFHTRSLSGDLGLALAWETRKVLRPDLRIALLSATLPVEEVQRVYGPLPLMDVPGRAHPVEIVHRPPLSEREQVWEGAARLCRESMDRLRPSGSGTVLCFLPGFFEMDRTRLRLLESLPGVPVVLLHGRLPIEEQRRVLDPEHAEGLRVILATNVAETSLTVPGVRAVVDSGLERSVGFSPRTGMDHWDTVPISRASAEQRAGRAGRLGPGFCLRWWDSSARRAEFTPPEIVRADLAPVWLETALWGAATPLDLTWLTPPPEAALARARLLLTDLGLLDARSRINAQGREAVRLGVHPRLARMMLGSRAKGRQWTAALIAALLENADAAGSGETDLRLRLAAVQAGGQGGGGIRRIHEEASRILRALGEKSTGTSSASDPADAGELLLLAYPDRAAQRTRVDDPGTSRWRLASGRGALVKGPLSRETFLAVADLDGGDADARVFLAAPITRADLEHGRAGTVQETWDLEWQGWRPRARVARRVGAIVLAEEAGRLPPAEVLQEKAVERLKREGIHSLPWDERGRGCLARARFVKTWGRLDGWPDLADPVLIERASHWLVPFGNWDGRPVWGAGEVLLALETLLGREHRRRLETLAPPTLVLPSGSVKRIDYESGEIPVLTARLQEFFGLTTTPTLCGQPLLLDLVSPAGRTLARTRDLDGFWDNAYPLVRKDMRGRYPRHPWPEDPRAAQATSRAKPRKKAAKA